MGYLETRAQDCYTQALTVQNLALAAESVITGTLVLEATAKDEIIIDLLTVIRRSARQIFDLGVEMEGALLRARTRGEIE